MQVNAGQFQDKHRGSVVRRCVSLTFGKPEMLELENNTSSLIFDAHRGNVTSEVRAHPNESSINVSMIKASSERLFYSLTAAGANAHQQHTKVLSCWGTTKSILPFNAKTYLHIQM